MSTIRFQATTTLTPEQFVAGLTDFGPGREEVFPNSADSYLKVHYLASGRADVTEGSGGIWERLTYDWTDPTRVLLTTTDSNVFGGASGYVYTLTQQGDGTTHVDLEIVREGKNVKGKALSWALGSVAKGSLRKAFNRSIQGIEAHNGLALPPFTG
ncbi:hypothetical protein FZI85_13260 [Mycobacterium sp. CBMA293]|uniref:hypothetical protein n=1 Tax=unclassified Mycolicibacterium TaxID=2636767 RepID=UPI0012DC74C3|nr:MULTISPECIES: hypothetical protein [unclassified Mycolicibacterium]MUL47518.1 hypothetical protein [Mycolicibacterium sp. CBMA 360]MUL59505.1 hypothetical protein [Mycolicibacterium sp. CBMA 335]MUL71230.1 hypothetical protein [Mycolicibacterium sp. CBMA 311]MUL94873.1 hypothetical protein [Mycolicibacterium sp. CBMA 230]MUM03713.1 hypothetical protein [Mycolicibacterium sp. CBMA 213]